MALSPFAIATELAIRLIGRDPEWVTHAIASTPPTTPTAGVDLKDSPSTHLYVAMREDVGFRTTRLTVTAHTIGDIFTTTIDGTAVAYDSTGDADLDETITGITNAINANGTVNVIVTAVDIDSTNGLVGTGFSDTVLITGDTEADYSIDFTDDGTSTVLAVTDYIGASARLYWKLGAAASVVAPAAWVSPDPSFAVSNLGWISLHATGGRARMYVRLESLSGHGSDGGAVTYRTPDLLVGPCIPEVS